MKLKSALSFVCLLSISGLLLSFSPLFAMEGSQATPTPKIPAKSQKVTDQAQTKTDQDTFQQRIDQRVQKIETLKAESEKRQEVLAENRCENINKRIENRIEMYTTVKENHLDQYTNLKVRLQAINQKLKTWGCTTTTLDADLKTLDTFIKDFTTANTELSAALTQSQKISCEEKTSQSQWAKNAQEEVKNVKEKGLAIRNFYGRTMKAHIQEIRVQCQETLKAKQTTKAAPTKGTKSIQEAQ